MADGFDLESFHCEAIETPSHESVDAMRELVIDRLEAAGVDPDVDEAGNVLATRGGDSAHLVFNTHLDTVPPHVPYERRATPPGNEGGPAAPEGEVVCGRGACDAKGPLAAMMAAFLRADPGDARLTLALSYDEETLQTGGAHLGETLAADGVVVGEPTGLDVCTAARGQCEGNVTVHGESAHAGDPASGENAIRAAAAVVEALERYDDERGPGEHDLLGEPTLTPTMVEGGEATNQVPGECTVTFDRRSVPPETAESFRADLADYLAAELPAVDCDVSLIRPDTPFPDPFETPPEDPLVETLQAAGGGDVRPFGAASEAAYFAERAPTVVFGPGVLTDDHGAVAHSEREYVPVADVHAAADTLERAAARYGK